MKEYHKIQTIFKRDQQTHRIIEGDYSLPEFAYLANNQWAFTEKVDGTNIRVMWDGQNVTFGGKTDNAQIPVKLLYALQALFEGNVNNAKLISVLGDGRVCLYGEGYGASIQKGGGNYKADGTDFVLFDVKIGDWWLERPNVEDIASKLGLRVVPLIGSGTLSDAIEMTRNGFKSQWGDFDAEGIVLRPTTELKTRRGDRIITKIKHRDFLS